MDLMMTLRAKGARGTLERFGTILERFGPGAARMDGYIAQYAAIAADFGACPTLPITARVMARQPGVVRRFVERGVEFAIHGLVHNDHAELGFEEQLASIRKAGAIFDRLGVPYLGFRAPYLRANAATGEAVRAAGLRYHSSQAVLFPIPADQAEGAAGDAIRRAIEFYGALDARLVAVRPRDRQGLIDIPVAIPDDEILLDRLHLAEAERELAWLRMLDLTHTRGDLFTVQLHAERVPQMAGALRLLLTAARQLQPTVWIAQLGEVAEWWARRRAAVPRVVEREPACHLVRYEGPAEGTLLVRGAPEVPSQPWHGAERAADFPSFEIESNRKPVVGLSGRTGAAARAFVEEEGFPCEVAAGPDGYGAYLDLPTDDFVEADVLAELDRAHGPLVRVGRWPNRARSALAVTGDIDSITLSDFAWRLWETRR